MPLVRRLGRANSWSHDYWKTIGWVEFWASVDEAEEAAQAERRAIEELQGGKRKPDPSEGLDQLKSQELWLAAQTGMPTPFADPSMN